MSTNGSALTIPSSTRLPATTSRSKPCFRLPWGKKNIAVLGETAAAAYAVAGCRDYGRIDMRLRDGVFYVLDINPNPDLSADASMAYAAEWAGFSYGALGSLLVALAARRHPLLRHHGAVIIQSLNN